MRLFIAIDIPDWSKQQLEQLQDPNLGVRWTTPDTMHLTLRFIGNVEEPGKQQELVDQLSSIQMPAFEMTIKDLGYFPPRKHPNIIWAGIEDNSRLTELQQKIEQACRTADFEPDRRSYIPHITIGRVKSASKKEVNSFINQHKRVRIEEIPVSEFILFESKLDSDGARHFPLERFGLIRESTEKEV